jgi:REP element-mobilizing transposase RayT
MPRRPRIIVQNTPQHVIQRGNNRQACFYADEVDRGRTTIYFLTWGGMILCIRL